MNPIVYNSPLAMSMLMHYYYSVYPWPVMADSQTKIIKHFVRIGVFTNMHPEEEHDRSNPMCYKVTRKGRAWVKLLCNTPCPQEAFIDQHGSLIDMGNE